MKLQDNFTTPEQSKRLMELGIPVDSTDCYLTRSGINDDWKIRALNYVQYSEIAINDQDYCIPCWSLGSLIEIVLKCLVPPDGQKPIIFFIDDPDISLIESLIIDLTDGRCKYDFSRLDLNEN